MIVDPKELGAGRGAFGFAEVGASVGPLLLQGAVKAVDLAGGDSSQDADTGRLG